MDQKSKNMPLTVFIIILCFVNFFIFFSSFTKSAAYRTTSDLSAEVMICCSSIILIIVIAAILFILVYKNMVKTNYLLITTIILVLLLFIGLFIMFSADQIEKGEVLYEIDEWKGGIRGNGNYIDTYGNYVVWVGGEKYGDNYLYLLNIQSDNRDPKILGETSSVSIYEDNVYWGDTGSIYCYNITEDVTEIVTNSSDNLMDVYKNIIVWFENENIYLYDILDNSEIVIQSEDIISPIAISGNYVVWYEFEGYPADYSYYYYDSSKLVNLMIYDISSGEKSILLSNITQLSNNGETLDIYGKKIVYSSNLDIYVYDILTEQINLIATHYMKGKASSYDKLIFDNIKICEDKVIYIETYNLAGPTGSDSPLCKCVDISSGKNVEINSGFAISTDYIVGIRYDFSCKTSKVYAIDLENLFG